MDIYKRLSEDLRNELKNLYAKLASVTQGDAAPLNARLFNETADQLKEAARATEDAANNIFNLCEEQQKIIDENIAKIKMNFSEAQSSATAGFLDSQEKLKKNVTKIIEQLSFQDLSGQRIKKALQTLALIEQSVVEVYVASGLMLEEAKERESGVNGFNAAENTKTLADFRVNIENSKLKGPDKNAISQDKVDDILSQLGL